ncbi:MAG: hypothetical protein HY650_00180 [Acidobacteria bacterium]|nr:hypothetical protein [Acidobacteriota bacterium]
MRWYVPSLLACVTLLGGIPPNCAAQVIEVQPEKPVGHIFSRVAGEARLQPPVSAIRPSMFESYDPERAGMLKEYDVREILLADYRLPGGEAIRAELLQAANFASSYGLYSLDRPEAAVSAGLGGASYETPHSIGLWQGEYYFRATCESGVADPHRSRSLRAIAATISRRLAVGPYELPPVIRALPESGLVGGSQRFVVGPLGLARFKGFDNPGDPWRLAGEGSEAAIGEYGEGPSHLMVAEYHTPQLASDAYARVSEHLKTLPESERNRRMFEREGNYLIGAFNVEDRAAMQGIIDQIRYRKIVQWLKPELPAPRLDDGSASAIRYYLTAFLFMGLALLVTIGAGILVGATLFLYRRRRLGAMPGFTDAGGMLRLNLDSLVLPSPERHKRLLG